MATTGFWGPVTSSVDWCESNYTWNWYIAEFWNTLSNFPPLIWGLFGLYLATRYSKVKKATVQPMLIWLGYFVPIIVFAGSSCFHATLTYTGQLLDELPMIYGSLYLHFMLNTRAWRGCLGATLLLLCGVAITVFMIVLRDSPLPLQLSYGAVVAVLVVRSALARFELNDPLAAHLIDVGALTYMVGFALWLLEQGICPRLSFFQFHAWWHLLTGFGTFLFIQFACVVAYRRQSAAVTTSTYMCGLLPYAYSPSAIDV